MVLELMRFTELVGVSLSVQSPSLSPTLSEGTRRTLSGRFGGMLLKQFWDVWGSGVESYCVSWGICSPCGHQLLLTAISC